jgi:uncharacterized protein (UPF0261 family)
MVQLGAVVAEKLNRYTNRSRVRVVIPGKGFSSLSAEGGILFDPEADRAFTDTLRKSLSPEIGVVEVDTDINSPDFARAVASAVLGSPDTTGRR